MLKMDVVEPFQMECAVQIVLDSRRMELYASHSIIEKEGPLASAILIHFQECINSSNHLEMIEYFRR